MVFHGSTDPIVHTSSESYSWPSLVVPYSEELFSRLFLDENQFWWVLQNRMDTEDAMGCFLFRSHSLLFCLSEVARAQSSFSRGFVQKRPNWISQQCNLAFLLYFLSHDRFLRSYCRQTMIKRLPIGWITKGFSQNGRDRFVISALWHLLTCNGSPPLLPSPCDLTLWW